MSLAPDPELLKSVANRLAATLAAGGQGSALRLLGTLLGAHQPDGSSAPSGAEAARTAEFPRRVGIWEERADGERRYFSRRPEAAAEWWLWANIGRIEARSARPRILLIGESVARGWFYEPHFTPASVLQKILAQTDSAAVEVIDLARTDLGLEIESLAIAALALRPDAVVMFAGNNWRHSLPDDPRELACLAASLRRGGVPELKRHVERELAHLARGVVERVSAAYAAQKVPLVWLVPEFNLADWRDQRGCPPCLTDGRVPEWLRACSEAEAALRDHAVDRADELARRIIELDEGTSATGFTILGECMVRGGDLPAARRWLELARDAEVWNWTGGRSPRPHGVTQAAVRSAADRPGVSVVDLPQVFANFAQGELPDRQLFLDYCHLTSTGIRVAMSAAAASVRQLLWARSTSWQELLSRSPLPSREADAEASLSAALHNAHWYQRRDTILHHCTQALQASEHVAAIMMHLADAQSHSIPPLLTQTAAWIASSCSQTIQRYVLRYNSHRYDDALVGCMHTALSAVGRPPSSDLVRQRIERHCAADAPQDLLDFYFLSSAEQYAEIAWITPFNHDERFARAAFYQAFGAESRFIFVASAGRPLNLRLCWRLGSQRTRNATAAILLNDRLLDELPLNAEWTVAELELPGALVSTGTNRLIIRWPAGDFTVEQDLAAAADGLLEQIMLPLNPVFGRIHSAVVGAGPLSPHLVQTWRNPF